MIELIVVVAIVSVLSAIILFDGGGSRDRHTAEGVYDVLDISLSQAVLLSRAQPNDSELQSATHWVLNSADNTVALYQDNQAGTGGQYDALDDVREVYTLDPSAQILSCDGPLTNCVEIDELLVLSWMPDSPEAVVREGEGVLSALYLEISVKDKIVNLSINTLGVIKKES